MSKNNPQHKEKSPDNLILSERNWKLIWDSIGSGVVYQDADGKVILMNPAAEKIMGKSMGDFPGKAFIDDEHEPIREDGSPLPKKEHPATVALRTGKEVNNVVMGVFNPNEKAYRWINISSTPLIREGENQPYQVYSIFNDITHHRKTEESLRRSEQRYRNLFESMDEGFALCEMIFNKQGRPIDFRYLDVNPAFTTLTGLKTAQVIGHTVKELIPDIEPIWIETYDKVVRSGISQRIGHPVSGLGKYIEVFAWRSGSGRFSAVFLDITQHRNTDEKLKKLYKKEKLQKEKLLEEVKIKNLFIDVLAHELRTPLSSIIACGEMLEDAPVVNESIRKRLTSNISLGANKLAKRLDELLDVARFSKGIFELKLQATDPRKLIKEATERFTPILIAKGQTLELAMVGELSIIISDQSRLEQVIINLLSNASKYSPENSVIRLTASMKNKNLLVEVADQGVGIDEKDKDHIFRAYHRISQIGHAAGTGLGLYISKGIVEAHHGKIWFTGQPGKGSIFSFSIPVEVNIKQAITR